MITRGRMTATEARWFLLTCIFAAAFVIWAVSISS